MRRIWKVPPAICPDLLQMTSNNLYDSITWRLSLVLARIHSLASASDESPGAPLRDPPNKAVPSERTRPTARRARHVPAPSLAGHGRAGAAATVPGLAAMPAG